MTLVLAMCDSVLEMSANDFGFLFGAVFTGIGSVLVIVYGKTD